MSALFRERLMHLPLISFLTEIWHLLDVSAVAEHGAVAYSASNPRRKALIFHTSCIRYFIEIVSKDGNLHEMSKSVFWEK